MDKNQKGNTNTNTTIKINKKDEINNNNKNNKSNKTNNKAIQNQPEIY